MKPAVDQQLRDLRGDLIVARCEGQPQAEIRSWHALARYHQAQGQRHQAAAAYAQALAKARAAGDWVRGAFVLCPLADLLNRLGRGPEARGLLGEAANLVYSLPTAGQRARLGAAVTASALALACPAQAVAAGRPALQFFRQQGHQRRELQLLQQLGTAYRATGQWGAAMRCFIQSVILAEALAAPRRAARAAYELGRLALVQHRPAAACGYFRAACRVFHTLAAPIGESRALIALGRSWLRRGEFVPAAACWQRAAALLAGRPAGIRRPPDVYLAGLRRRLGAEGFEQVWQAGQRLDLACLYRA